MSFERFDSLICEEVNSGTTNLKNWMLQVLDPFDPNFDSLMTKISWLDAELTELVIEPRRLVHGINKDLLDGSLLHFLPLDAEVIDLNGNREVARRSYGVIFKCHIIGVDFIPREEEYACKAFISTVHRNSFQSMNIEATSCPLVHPLFMKLFAIHPSKPHGYMRWWNAGTLRSMVLKRNGKSRMEPGVDADNVKLFQRLRIRLSWHFLFGMLFLYKNGSIHCDLSPDNILLHREEDNMYIGVCDWGFACKIEFPLLSNYAYPSQKELEADRIRRPWVDPSLMSVYGSKVAKFSLATDVYVTSRIASWIIGPFDEDSEISSTDYEIYTHGLWLLSSEPANECYNTLLQRVKGFQRSIPILRNDPMECYRKIK